MKKFLAIVVGFVLQANMQSSAQDPSFSQIEPVLSFSNPAYTDFNKNFEATVLFREQWHTVPTDKFRSYFVSVNYNPELLRVGFNLNYFQDEEGILKVKTSSLRMAVKYKSNLAGNFFGSAGIYGGFHKKSINNDDFVFSDQIDPVTGVSPFSNNVFFDDNKTVADAGFGINLSFAGGRVYSSHTQSESNMVHVTAGYSMAHAGKKESTLLAGSDVVDLPPLQTYTLSATIVGKHFYSFLFNPAAKYDSQGELKRLVWGSYFGYGFRPSKSIVFTGLFHAQNTFPAIKTANTSAVILLIGYEFKMGDGMFTLACSRDTNYKGLAQDNISYGAWEISLVYAYGTKLKSNIFKTHETVCFAWPSF